MAGMEGGPGGGRSLAPDRAFWIGSLCLALFLIAAISLGEWLGWLH